MTPVRFEPAALWSQVKHSTTEPLRSHIKLLCLYLVQHMLHQIEAQQFYTDLGLNQQCLVPQKIVEFKEFSRLLSDFPVLFKADLIFKYFSRKPS